MMHINGNRIQGVVFDMDGVLIDSHPAHFAAWREFLRLEGAETSDCDLSFILEGHTRNEILCHFLGDRAGDDLDRLGKRKDEIFRGLEHRIQLLPGVFEFLRDLHRLGIATAVATSASEIRTFSTVERLGIAEFFGAVITACDVDRGKPDPAAYRLACERLEVPPHSALAFDDAPAGIQSAKSAGLRCIGVSSNGMAQRLLDAGAEQVIKTFTSLTLNKFAPDHFSEHPETEPELFVNNRSNSKEAIR